MSEQEIRFAKLIAAIEKCSGIDGDVVAHITAEGDPGCHALYDFTEDEIFELVKKAQKIAEEN